MPAKTELQTFKVGDTVRWISSNTYKVGTVTHVVPERKIPLDVGVKLEGGMPRDHESYIVRGQKEHRSGSLLKPKANYWRLSPAPSPSLTLAGRTPSVRLSERQRRR